MRPALEAIPCSLTDVYELVAVRHRRLIIGAVAVKVILKCLDHEQATRNQ